MVSVVIPTYNRSNSIMKTLESVINQTYRDLEIIVVDDGSNDNTESLISSISDARIRFIRHSSNLGACAARNTGIENSKGEYIAFQDSDDEWHKEKIDIELKTLIKHNADVVFCKMNKIINGKTVDIVGQNYSEGFLGRKTDLLQIGTQTLIGKSEVFKNNHFDIEMPRYQELELLIRIFENNSIYCCNEVLVDYFFDDSLKSISGNPFKHVNACKLLLKKHPDLFVNHPDVAKGLARVLFVLPFQFPLPRQERNEIWKLAIKMDKRVKTKVKYLLAKIGLLRP